MTSDEQAANDTARPAWAGQKLDPAARTCPDCRRPLALIFHSTDEGYGLTCRWADCLYVNIHHYREVTTHEWDDRPPHH